MSVSVPPSTRNHVDRPSEDEMDELLRAFYQSELPNPWPALAAPAQPSIVLPFRSAKPRFALTRTRWALAACVAFLVAGTLLVSSCFNRTNSNIEAQATEPARINVADTKQPFKETLEQKEGRTSIKIVIPYGSNK
jgi:hypothetical protein